MLTGIHFLLTYNCTFECDHCFLYCSPFTDGTFTIAQVDKTLKDAAKIGTIKQIYFEGGESFIYYPLLLESVKRSRAKKYSVGIVTNGYWATSVEDAKLWLKPLLDLGIYDFSISDDPYHQGDEDSNLAKNALKAAKKLGAPTGSICIEKPQVTYDEGPAKGQPIIGGGAMLRGRAVEKLTEGLPTSSFKEFVCCPHEELEKPNRVHIDCFGNVHICQGISMGNMWKTPLSKMVKAYDAKKHPICGPLVEGGPVALAKKHKIKPDKEYVDACHFCFLVRKALIDRFPDYLAPRHVYGLE